MLTVSISPCMGQSEASSDATKEQTPVTTTTRTIQVEHVTLRSTKRFADVRAKLERSLPQLNPEIPSLMASGDTKRLQEKLEAGPEIAIFLSRDHGGLLRITGQPRKAVQYEIGNPLTASKMTRHQLAAGLYAPLRVSLYEDQEGGSIFEYDRPSSLFGQFGDQQVDEVARGLDVALERALRQALE
jgi:uncharacterized protein (DUF302 family)